MEFYSNEAKAARELARIEQSYAPHPNQGNANRQPEYLQSTQSGARASEILLRMHDFSYDPEHALLTQTQRLALKRPWASDVPILLTP